MMMRMLARGGIEPLTDEQRAADEDNPRGYFELEAVKRTDKDASWLDAANGKAVKIISQLLPELPSDRNYKVIFIRRSLDEVLASQKKMLDRRGEAAGAADNEMKEMFVAHLEEIEAWLRKQPHVEVLFVNYTRILADPRKGAERIHRFLGGTLDVDAMAEAVDPSLYRNRQIASP